MDVLSLFSLLPLWYQVLMVGFLGAIMSSFINVVAYRMHTNVSLKGRSRCFSCGHTLAWFELVPILSYTVLRGRCRCCHARIPLRDFAIELLGAALYIQVLFTFDSLLAMVLSWLLVSALLAVAVYDIEHFIIPDELVVTIGGFGLLYAVSQSFPQLFAAVPSLAGAIMVAAGLYLVLWKYSHGRWLGFGDVKLAAVLGLFLTVEGAFSMVILSFWIGAAVGLLLIAISYLKTRYLDGVQSRKVLTMKSEIPFAPFIVVAFLLVYVYEISVFSFFVPWF